MLTGGSVGRGEHGRRSMCVDTQLGMFPGKRSATSPSMRADSRQGLKARVGGKQHRWALRQHSPKYVCRCTLVVDC